VNGAADHCGRRRKAPKQRSRTRHRHRRSARGGGKTTESCHDGQIPGALRRNPNGPGRTRTAQSLVVVLRVFVRRTNAGHSRVLVPKIHNPPTAFCQRGACSGRCESLEHSRPGSKPISITVPVLDSDQYGQSESLLCLGHQVSQTSQASSAWAAPSPNEMAFLELNESVLPSTAVKLQKFLMPTFGVCFFKHGAPNSACRTARPRARREALVWSRSYSTEEGRALREQTTHLTEQSFSWLTPPWPSSSSARHSRTLVTVLPSEPSCISDGSSGREDSMVEARVLRRGGAAMTVGVDSGERGGAQRRRWGKVRR